MDRAILPTPRVRRRQTAAISTLAILTAFGVAGVTIVAMTADHTAPVAAQSPRTVRALAFAPAGEFGGGFGEVAADGTRAFAVHGALIEAYDVADPDAPHLIGASGPIAGLRFISAADGRIAAIGQPAGDPAAATLTVLDSRASGSPTTLTAVDLTPCHAARPQIAGGIAAVACGPEGVRLVDVRDASRPSVVRIDVVGSAEAVAYDGRRLLVGKAVGEKGRMGELMLYDAGDPSRPQLVATGPWPSAVTVVGIAGEHAIVADNRGFVDVSVVRLDAPARWLVTAQREFDSYFAPHIATSGTRAQVALSIWIRGDSEVLDVDTARPDGPWVGDHHFLWGTTDVAPLPSGALVSDTRRGLVAYARGNDGALVERGHVPALSNAYGAAFDGDRLFVADDDAELWVLGVDDPAAITVRGRTSLSSADDAYGSITTFGGGLAFDEHRVLVTRGGNFDFMGGVALVAVGDAAAPRTLGTWSIYTEHGPVKLPKDPYGFDTNRQDEPVVVPGGMLISGSEGMTELDTTDPSAPHFRRLFRDWRGCLVDNVQGHCNAQGIAVDGETAYVAQNDAGVRVYDLSAGAPTSAVRTFAGPEEARDVAVVGDALLVVHAGSSVGAGLRVIDRRSGQAVRSVLGFRGYRIDVVGDTAYVVAEQVAGGPLLIAFDIADPFTPVERGRLALDARMDMTNRPPNVAVRGDLLAVVSAEAGVQLFHLTDGAALPAVDPGPTVTPWPTWAPPDPRTPSPTSEVQPLPTRTSEVVATVPPPLGDDLRVLFMPIAVSRP
ncbi:MAG: hypothetical protein ABI780_14130 [Ardenticatenales bacterium]